MISSPQITLIKEGKKLSHFELEDTLDVGRDPESRIHLPHFSISRKHLLLKKVGEEIRFQKKSEFGIVKVNGIEQTQLYLKPGDRVEVGPYVLEIGSGVQESLAGIEELEIPEQTPFKSNSNFEERLENSSLDPSPVEEAAPFGESSERAQLVIQSGVTPLSEYEIQKNEVYIGRSLSCDLVLEDQEVSRKNTLIFRTEDGFKIKDLNSKNGTFLDGVRIQEKELNEKNEIQIGKVKILFQNKKAQAEPTWVSAKHLAIEKRKIQKLGFPKIEWNNKNFLYRFFSFKSIVFILFLGSLVALSIFSLSRRGTFSKIKIFQFQKAKQVSSFLNLRENLKR